MKNWFKKLRIPSGDTTEVIAYNSWIVRWKSWHGSDTSYPDGRWESEIFPSEDDALKFAASIRDAYTLTKCGGNCFKVWVTENQNKLASLGK